LHFDFGHHSHVPHAHAGSAGHAGHGAGVDFTQVSPFNVPSIMAFLAWFGGVGYLMEHNFNAGLGATVVVSLVGGFAGGSAVFFFLAKLASFEGSLDPADDEMVGVIANVDSAIRNGGTGEIVYLVRGIRHACGARTENGSTMPKGEEVVVTRFEHGIAYVRKWEEFADSGSHAANG
jgi:membrane protein implicated in regulation of membrane protease activity